jgi:hypothetical protein
MVKQTHEDFYQFSRQDVPYCESGWWWDMTKHFLLYYALEIDTPYETRISQAPNWNFSRRLLFCYFSSFNGRLFRISL